MNAFALHRFADRTAPLRWTGSAALIVALHAGLIAGALAWYSQPPASGGTMPAILIDMAPATAAPQARPTELAPGPEMQQAEAAPPPEPEPIQPPLAQQIEPTPPQQNPVVAALPEPKAEPPPKPAEPAKVVTERPKPKPSRTAARHPTDEQPAPRTTAPPRAQRSAPSVSGAAAGAAAAAALPAYRSRLAAHLHRFQQYPAGARSAGEQGTAMLSLTVGRGGQVLSSRLAGSSGHPALDAETLATIRRAQPLPPFPPELTQASLNFTVPMQFSLR